MRIASTTTRWRPTRWLWTSTTFLVAVIGPASALTIRSSSSSSNYRRALSATRSDGSTDAANPASGSFTTHSSLSELLKEFNYDALILDQFGVLHNGKDALEGTIDCVETIALGRKFNDGADADAVKQKKLQLIVLSNTSSPSSTTLDRLHTKLGFDRSYFCGAVTSGEEAGRHIREIYGSSKIQKSRFVWCTWDVTNENVPDPNAFLDLCGSNVEPTVDVSSADFVVAHGSGAIRGVGKHKNGGTEIISMGSFLDDGDFGKGTPINTLLEECADRNLPLICANPDMVVQYHDGSLKHMPGKIAQRYKEILEEQRSSNDDGYDDATAPPSPSITIYGKPHTKHFEACLRELEENRNSNDDGKTEPLRVAHVGDSLHHDIAGANASGVPSIFIVGGIHAEELLLDTDAECNIKMPSQRKLKEFFDKEGITPTHVLSVFNY